MTAAAAQAETRAPQSLWLVAALMLNAIVSLLTIPLFVELLSGAELAVLAQASGIAFAVSTICGLGANTIGPHIVSGKLVHLRSYDQLLANQLFVALCLLGVLALAAVFADFSATTLMVFALNYAGGVVSAICPNWLMVQIGLAQRIFRYHMVGRAIYVAALLYFAFVGGGLVAVSLGVFAGAALTTVLIFRATHSAMPFKVSVRPTHLASLFASTAVTFASVATAVFASVTPFILEGWIGVSAVALFYVVERARLFVTEIIRSCEAPFYQHIAMSDPGEHRNASSFDGYAMPLGALLLALAFPVLASIGPKLGLIDMLRQLWPFLTIFCIAAAVSTRAVTLFVDGQRAFLTGAVVRIAATIVASAGLVALALQRYENAYAVAIILVEVVVAVSAVVLAFCKRR
jgi:O-antigen/teichoic acid export membrane protein